MSQRFTKSLRDTLMAVNEVKGTMRPELPTLAVRTLLKMDFVDFHPEIEHLVMLTDTGRAVRELVVEIRALEEQAKRMREGVFADMVDDRPRKTPRGAEPPPLRIPDRAAAGNLNHDSFAVFLASLNAAGKNRWREPGFTGDAPVRAAQPGREGNDDEG